MGTRITRTYTYEGSVDSVLAILTDEKLYSDAAIRSRALSYEVEVSPDGERTAIMLHRRLPTEDVPSFARSLVGEALDVTEHTWWGAADDAGADGTFEVAVRAAPISYKGTMRLDRLGTTTSHTIDGTLSASVPLLGRRIEQSMSAPIVLQLDVLAELVGTRLAAG